MSEIVHAPVRANSTVSRSSPARYGPMAVFGASGRTGALLVELALEQGRAPIALCRSASASSQLPFGAILRRASLLDHDSVVAGLKDVRTVVCAFGPRPPYTDVFCAEATRRILDAMHEVGVRRLVCLTGAMVGDAPGNQSAGVRLMARMYARQNPDLAADREEQERLVVESGLDWTLVKPPRLTDGPPRGQYKAGPDLSVSIWSRISRADLARFLYGLATSDRHIRERVFVRY